jgi:hypothetical protein
VEFACVVESSDWDEHFKLTKAIADGTIHFTKRTQPSRSKQKTTCSAKRRYELVRRYVPLHVGAIEREFGRPLTLALHPLGAIPETVTCIDQLLTGKVVDMRTLERLFGRDRKLLPPALPVNRVGRKTSYNYSAFALCLTAVLNERSSARRWPRENGIRPLVIGNLIKRVNSHASGKIKHALLKALLPASDSGGA